MSGLKLAYLSFLVLLSIYIGADQNDFYEAGKGIRQQRISYDGAPNSGMEWIRGFVIPWNKFESGVEERVEFIEENSNSAVGLEGLAKLNKVNIRLVSLDSVQPINGFNFSGVEVYSEIALSGVNVATLVVGSAGDISGFNLAAIIINAGDDLSGFSIAGQSIGVGKRLSGFAFAGLHLRVGGPDPMGEGRLSGVAVSAINEINGRNDGLSMGVINRSSGGNGVQIGLLNYNAGNPWWSRLLPVINVDFSRYKVSNVGAE